MVTGVLVVETVSAQAVTTVVLGRQLHREKEKRRWKKAVNDCHSALLDHCFLLLLFSSTFSSNIPDFARQITYCFSAVIHYEISDWEYTVWLSEMCIVHPGFGCDRLEFLVT